MSPTFRRATAGDVETIRALADRIWWTCYPGILSPEQIRYMLGWMYAPHKLTAELAHGVTYELVEQAGAPVGFLGYEPLPGRPALMLNKLYLVPELHGRGLGQAMLQRVFQAARGLGLATVELRVNKANVQALRAYERAGFVTVESLCQDIGGGFVMDDYVLRRELAGQR